MREAIAERLADHGFIVEQAASGEQALQRLADFAFDILITDLRLPGIDGGKVIHAALERYPEIIAIVITGYGTVKDAVEAIKQGAADSFQAVPVRRPCCTSCVRARQRRLKSENTYSRSQLKTVSDRRARRAAARHARSVSAPRDRSATAEHGPTVHR